jgi:hypothetical protein
LGMGSRVSEGSVKRKAGKSRTVYTLELSPKEWCVVGDAMQRIVDNGGGFHDWTDRKIAARIRERMAVDDRARARKGKL